MDTLTILLLVVPTALGGLVFLELRRQRSAINQIHGLVNSQLSGVKADLVLANDRIQGLLRLINHTKETHP